jgi:hypothetical protein
VRVVDAEAADIVRRLRRGSGRLRVGERHAAGWVELGAALYANALSKYAQCLVRAIDRRAGEHGIGGTGIRSRIYIGACFVFL